MLLFTITLIIAYKKNYPVTFFYPFFRKIPRLLVKKKLSVLDLAQLPYFLQELQLANNIYFYNNKGASFEAPYRYSC